MASDKAWLESVGTPLAGARSALADCAGMLKALGYTLKSAGSDATGELLVYVHSNGTEVRLEAIDHNE